MEPSIIERIMARRSIRRFSGDRVDPDVIRQALRAAMAAPSANNGRPWHFVVVTEPETIRELCSRHPYAGFGKEAGAVILPFGRKTEAKWFDQDFAAATENLLLALANLGLGATWCGMDDAKQASIREPVDLPEDQYVFALIPIGVPAEEKAPRTQYEESRVHWQRYART